MAGSFSVDIEQFIRESKEKGITHKEMSERLQELYPGQRGFSVRSVERFCQQHDIYKTSQLRSGELCRVVATAVSQVSNMQSR